MSITKNKAKDISNKRGRNKTAVIFLLIDLFILVVSYVFSVAVRDYNISRNIAFFDGYNIYTMPKTITITLICFFALPFILFVFSNKNKILLALKIIFMLFVWYWCVVLCLVDYSALLCHNISYVNSDINDKCVVIDENAFFDKRNLHFYQLLDNGMVYYLGMTDRDITGVLDYNVKWEKDCFEFIGSDDEGEIYFKGKFMEELQ